MEKALVLLFITLAVAYAVPDPRGIIFNLVRGSSRQEASGPPFGIFFKLGFLTPGGSPAQELGGKTSLP